MLWLKLVRCKKYFEQVKGKRKNPVTFVVTGFSSRYLNRFNLLVAGAGFEPRLASLSIGGSAPSWRSLRSLSPPKLKTTYAKMGKILFPIPLLVVGSVSKMQNKKIDITLRDVYFFILVAGAGFEPTTFGL